VERGKVLNCSLFTIHCSLKKRGEVILKYLRVSVNRRLNNVIWVPKISEEEVRNSNGMVKQVELVRNGVFLNFYEKPFAIVSDKMKKAIAKQCPDAIGQPLGLANMNNRFETLYWFLDLETVLGKATGSEIRFNESDIAGHKPDAGEDTGHESNAEERTKAKIFKVRTGMMDHVIVDYDLAEIVLRNLITDVEFEEVHAL